MNKSGGPLAFALMLFGNSILALGPWLVRLSDTGPVATGAWRLILAMPLLYLAARGAKQTPHWPRRTLVWMIAGAALFYALDLAAWNAAILRTKLGNSTLFGNTGSIVFAVYGLIIASRAPSPKQVIALSLALAGGALLMSGSYELSARHFFGDILALVAGLFYGGYLILIERSRATLQPLPLLFLATLFAIPPLVLISALFGEKFWPTDWTPLLLFALSSQVVGQGLLVYSIGVFPPLVVGLALLTQPIISALVGWMVFGEALTLTDVVGAFAIAAGLVLVRLPDKGLRRRGAEAS
jgi:drug/metabolite transporter (DMT)-like permease